MSKSYCSRTTDEESFKEESLSSDYSITKKITFCSRNDLSKNLTYDDCNEILQIYGIQQGRILDQLECFAGNIKITIKDKANPKLNQESLHILKRTFNALLIYTKHQKRLRLLNQKIQISVNRNCIKKAFYQWRKFTYDSKRLTLKKKDECKLEDMKKIESFIETINNHQKNSKQGHKRKNSVNLLIDKSENGQMNDKNLQPNSTNKHLKSCFTSSNSSIIKNYLEANKKIIAKQRMKLAEQNRIIEEIKLKKIQAESKLAEMETLNAVSTITNYSGRSRKIFNNLIKAHKENKTDFDKNTSTVNTPHFLIRMEARATMRREQIQRRNEERRIKIEQQLKLEQAMKIEEEKRRKQLEKESRTNAKQIKAQEEEAKKKRLEKIKSQNELADNFYKRYLLKNFGIIPIIQYRHMMKRKYNHIIMKKMFSYWKYKTTQQMNNKLNFYKNLYKHKLLKNNFQLWRTITLNRIRRRQYIEQHYNFRCQKYYFNKWITITVSMKAINNENYQKAENFDNKKTISKYFKIWIKYLQVLDKIKDSDRQKNLLRQLVLTVIPDFAPEVRGVCIDD